MTILLGKLASRFFGYIQARQLQTVQTGDLVQNLGLTPLQEKKLLSLLFRRSMIARVRRGLYLVPPRLPVGGKWGPDTALALTTLMQDREASYQICGPNTFSRYGWDTQIPNRTYVYNTRFSGERQIGAVSLTLIKVSANRLGETEMVTSSEGIQLLYSSRLRSLLDAVYDWSRFNTIPRAYQWIREELQRENKSANTLVSLSIRYGNQGTIRRMGKLLETEGVPLGLLRKLEKSLRTTSSFIPWNPTLPKRGTADKRWGLVMNDD